MTLADPWVVKLYGIADRTSGDVDEWHATREEAEATLARVLGDKSDWADELYIVEVEKIRVLHGPSEPPGIRKGKTRRRLVRRV